MNTLSLRRYFILFLVLLPALQSRVAVAGDLDFNAVDGCAYQSRHGQSTSKGMVELASAKDPVLIHYPAAILIKKTPGKEKEVIQENIQMGYFSKPLPLLAPPATAGGGIIEQTLTQTLVYCEVAGDHQGGHPYLKTGTTDAKVLNKELAKKGLKMQYKVNGQTEWMDIDKESKVELTELTYKFFYNDKLNSDTEYRRVNYTTFDSGIMPKNFTLGLRLVLTGNTVPNNDGGGITMGTLFYVLPKISSTDAEGVAIRSPDAFKFAVARCRPKVTISPEVLDFGTLTQDRLNRPSVVAKRDFNVTVSKDYACGGVFEKTKYDIPNLKIFFKPTGGTNTTQTAPLQNNEGGTFPGLSYSIIRKDHETTVFSWNGAGEKYFTNNGEHDFVGVDNDDTMSSFTFRIQKDTANGETIGLGQFQASATVQVMFN